MQTQNLLKRRSMEPSSKLVIQLDSIHTMILPLTQRQSRGLLPVATALDPELPVPWERWWGPGSLWSSSLAAPTPVPECSRPCTWGCPSSSRPDARSLWWGACTQLPRSHAWPSSDCYNTLMPHQHVNKHYVHLSNTTCSYRVNL